MVRQVDFVLESFPPGYLDTKGLVYAALKAYNSAIILTSITPFGQSGPYHDDKGLDTEFSRGKRTKRDVRVLNDRKPWRGGT